MDKAGCLKRSWYSGTISEFLQSSDDHVFAELNRNSPFGVLTTQRDAWLTQLNILKDAVANQTGSIYLEFEIPRMGHRVDAILLVEGIVIAIEFKVGATEFLREDIDQAYDYATDLKYFHEASHHLSIVPVLVASEARAYTVNLRPHPRIEGLFEVIQTNAANLKGIINLAVENAPRSAMTSWAWEESRYCPTPTIIEAARALYAGHEVADISRNDAGAINLQETSQRLTDIIEQTRVSRQKAICFITGVPGAGKTLVGLNIATKFSDNQSELHSVFLSGNGPLVAILREALARDMVRRERNHGKRIRKGDAVSRVKAFIQNVHHFRDEGLRDLKRPPVDHVALFDEAQRAWNKEQTSSFMRRKKGVVGFDSSEPEFLISCMDRRQDWAVIVCLVGGGQEINTGEAGISEWISAIKHRIPSWHVYVSPALSDSEYAAGHALRDLGQSPTVHYEPSLHLGVSMRSFRAGRVSEFVKMVLDCEAESAQTVLSQLHQKYPILLTRSLGTARTWLRNQATGTERYGIVVSSQAERLKPHSLDVRTPVNPIKWFLDGKDDVRSSYYLEDVATEFHVQGLELDWACVAWDADFRYSPRGWQHFSFRGKKWQRINMESRRTYLKNAYRVLLTRARQGMIIFVPEGSPNDPTRNPDYYDCTFSYLRSLGLEAI